MLKCQALASQVDDRITVARAKSEQIFVPTISTMHLVVLEDECQI
jgi:hypothetical protein